MPKPRKLTLAEAEKIARTEHPEEWARLSPAERKALVEAVNDDHARAAEADALIERMLRPCTPQSKTHPKRRN
ncbi:MAG TPA: hypothetical protein VMT54_12725 [Candidatus Cybelea sp.]|nr:hypothetical protein [Candidatus Cybelea sp.]